MRTLIILLGSLIICLLSCKGGAKEKPSGNKGEDCIRTVLSKDTSLGSKRNNECKEVSLSTTIDRYVISLSGLDYSECPNLFTEAFKSHIDAWVNMKQVTDSFPNLRGELHDLFDQIEGSKDSIVFKKLLADVWSTWEIVEKESKVFE
ncbi:MAG: hypothetical protein HKN68_01000 [Saprospiraceae bacterium]|nr:hypothetical protein [Saprospiraceae bacterium]